jgi:hypothetical protein
MSGYRYQRWSYRDYNGNPVIVDNSPEEPEPCNPDDPYDCYGPDGQGYGSWYDEDPFARRRRMAEALLQAASNTSPIQGGALEFGARILQGALGAIMNHRARKEENAWFAEQDQLDAHEQAHNQAGLFQNNNQWSEKLGKPIDPYAGNNSSAVNPQIGRVWGNNVGNPLLWLAGVGKQ